MIHIPPMLGLLGGCVAVVLGGRILMFRALDAVSRPTEAERRVLIDRRLDKIRTVWQREPFVATGSERRKRNRRGRP